ncbi:MAG TPA: filamentous hemagglutinin N-terminal domain-containing protein [Tepidisphaeraceae bacterium]
MRRVVRVHSVLAVAFCSAGFAAAPPTLVRIDGTVARPRSVRADPRTGVAVVPASASRIVGGNAYYSFSRFDVAAGDQVRFVAPAASTQRLLVRVTGGRASRVDGVVDTQAAAGAHLYFLNPAGIAVGPGGKFLTGGALVLSTADTIDFVDGLRFDAGDARPRPVLSASAPAAFGFLSGGPRPITLDGGRGATAGQPVGDLMLLGGPIDLRNYKYDTIDGSTQVIAFTGPGRVVFDASAFSTQAAVPQAGRSTLTMRDNATLANIGVVSTTPRLLSVQAAEVSIRGAITDNPAVLGLAQNAARGPDVRIDAGRVALHGGSRVVSALSASTTPDARAGDVYVRAGEIRIEGPTAATLAAAPLGAAISFAGVFADNAPGSAGRSGSIDLVARRLRIGNLGQISTSTFGVSPAGDVRVRAASLALDGGGQAELTGIAANAGGVGANARGGAVVVRATGDIDVRGGAAVATNAFGDAASGSISVRARSVTVTGPGDDSNPTGFFASAGLDAPRGRGAAGGITVRAAESIDLREGGRVSGRSDGLGDGGAITLAAPRVTIDNAVVQASARRGRAGGIGIDAGTFRVVAGGEITAAALGNAGGDVTIIARDGPLIVRDALVRATAFLDGGNVVLQAHGEAIVMSRARIDAASLTDAATTVAGGNIRLLAARVALAESALVASAVAGGGGAIDIDALSALATPDTTFDVSSVAGPPGSLTLATPLIDLSGLAVPLSVNPLPAGDILRLDCAASVLPGAATFTVQPAGGLRTGGSLIGAAP